MNTRLYTSYKIQFIIRTIYLQYIQYMHGCTVGMYKNEDKKGTSNLVVNLVFQIIFGKLVLRDIPSQCFFRNLKVLFFYK